MMKTFFVLSLIFSLPYCIYGQNVIVKEFPKIDLSIQLSSNIYSTSDSIRFEVRYTNKTDSIQSFLHNAKDIIPPMVLSVNLKSIGKPGTIKYINRNLLSSQLYTAEQLESKGLISHLKPSEVVTESYRLIDIVIFSHPAEYLPKGLYELTLNYYTNFSNKVVFQIN